MNEKDLAAYERSRSLANFHLHAVELQIARIRTHLEPDEHFIFRQIADFEFLLVSLVRLRRAVVLASSIPAIKSDMETALAKFDRAIPRLVTLRNVSEHFDDYVLKRGKDKSLTSERFLSGLEVASFSNKEFEWFDATVNFDDCFDAAKELFFALRRVLHQ